MDKSKQTVGEFLYLLRKEKGLTQKEAAGYLGISDRTVSRWETDRGLPDIEFLPKLANLYGITVDELLAGERSIPQTEAEPGVCSEPLDWEGTAEDAIQTDRKSPKKIPGVLRILPWLLLALLLPFFLGREYNTFQAYKREIQARVGLRKAEKLTEESKLTLYKMAYGDTIEEAKEKAAAHSVTVKTYFQYLPLSIFTVLVLWKLFRLCFTLHTRSGKKIPWKYPVAIGTLAASLALIYYFTYFLGYQYADHACTEAITYDTQKAFDTYVNGYLETYASINAYNKIVGKPQLPDLTYGVKNIDPTLLDTYMPNVTRTVQYRNVKGFNYDTLTVYKTGDIALWLNAMGHWNWFICLTATLSTILF